MKKKKILNYENKTEIIDNRAEIQENITPKEVQGFVKKLQERYDEVIIKPNEITVIKKDKNSINTYKNQKRGEMEVSELTSCPNNLSKEEIINTINECRKNGDTQKEVSKKIGVSQSTVSRLENENKKKNKK